MQPGLIAARFVSISVAAFAVALVLSLALASPARSDDAAIRSVIEDQIAAFRDDDFARAFGFASPGIKRLFGSSEQFGQMVQNGYPMVYRPDDIRFLDLREVAGRLWQRVQITDQAGVLHLLDYEMVQIENGWQINAVQLLRAPSVGT